jgi:hypothetical protein
MLVQTLTCECYNLLWTFSEETAFAFNKTEFILHVCDLQIIIGNKKQTLAPVILVVKIMSYSWDKNTLCNKCIGFINLWKWGNQDST